MSRYELNSKYILKTDNANYAVDLTDVKSYLKIDYTTDDALLQLLIKTATLLIEKYTRRELLNKTFNLYLDFFPYSQNYGYTFEGINNENTILVKRSKLQSITSIKYYYNSSLETLDSSLYSFTQDNDYSRIYLINNNSWVSTDTRKQAINIEFVAGYGATNSSIPQVLKDALKIIIAYMYANRGDCVIVNDTSDIVMMSGALPILDMYKIIEI
jgi:uncharacterized phiE125 gp8 family phage protein